MEAKREEKLEMNDPSRTKADAGEATSTSEAKSSLLQVRLTSGLKRRLKETAEAHGVTQTKILEVIIEDFVAGNRRAQKDVLGDQVAQDLFFVVERYFDRSIRGEHFFHKGRFPFVISEYRALINEISGKQFSSEITMPHYKIGYAFIDIAYGFRKTGLEARKQANHDPVAQREKYYSLALKALRISIDENIEVTERSNLNPIAFYNAACAEVLCAQYLAEFHLDKEKQTLKLPKKVSVLRNAEPHWSDIRPGNWRELISPDVLVAIESLAHQAMRSLEKVTSQHHSEPLWWLADLAQNKQEEPDLDLLREEPFKVRFEQWIEEVQKQYRSVEEWMNTFDVRPRDRFEVLDSVIAETFDQ